MNENLTDRRRRIVERLAARAEYQAPRFSDQRLDFATGMVLLLEAKLAKGARTVAEWFPVRPAAYDDADARAAIVSFCRDNFQRDIPQILLANQNIIGPVRKLPA